jgi:hypothetical protein
MKKFGGTIEKIFEQFKRLLTKERAEKGYKSRRNSITAY